MRKYNSCYQDQVEVRVDNKYTSIDLQEKAFSAGFEWYNGEKVFFDVPYSEYYLIFNLDEKKITYNPLPNDGRLQVIKEQLFGYFDAEIKKQIEKIVADVNGLFSREPTKGEMAWGIVHDVCNIILQYMDNNEVEVKDRKKIDKALEKLNPESTIKDVAKIFFKIGLNPEWSIWFETKEEQNG